MLGQFVNLRALFRVFLKDEPQKVSQSFTYVLSRQRQPKFRSVILLVHDILHHVGHIVAVEGNLQIGERVEGHPKCPDVSSFA